MNVSVLLSNPLINAGVASWGIAQILKTIIDFFKHKQFNRQRLAGAGGMPSSHAAVTCSVLLSSYLHYGFASPIFALAFIHAFVVMYDAVGVRWSAGLHAKAINQIVDYLETDPELTSPDAKAQKRQSLQKLIPTLNESIGHRMIEVICGAILGIGISLLFFYVC